MRHQLIRIAIAAVLLLSLGPPDAAAADEPMHCSGHPEWEIRYEALRNYDHTSGEAIEWFHERGCRVDTASNGRPVCDDSIPCDASSDQDDSGDSPPDSLEDRKPRVGDDATTAAGNGATEPPPVTGCALSPQIQVSPLSAPIGAAIVANLVDRRTSAPWRASPGARVSWTNQPQSTRPMRITATDQSAASYTVQSADPGLVTILASVCGEALQTTVAWIEEPDGASAEARRWYDNLWLWRAVTLGVGAAWAIQHVRQGPRQ